jgi:hypothetical protein
VLRQRGDVDFSLAAFVGYDARRHHDSGRVAAMWIIFLEAGIALGIAVFIVWWTWPKKSDDGKRDGEGDGR